MRADGQTRRSSLQIVTLFDYHDTKTWRPVEVQFSTFSTQPDPTLEVSAFSFTSRPLYLWNKIGQYPLDLKLCGSRRRCGAMKTGNAQKGRLKKTRKSASDWLKQSEMTFRQMDRHKTSTQRTSTTLHSPQLEGSSCQHSLGSGKLLQFFKSYTRFYCYSSPPF